MSNTIKRECLLKVLDQVLTNAARMECAGTLTQGQQESQVSSIEQTFVPSADTRGTSSWKSSRS